MQHKIHGYCSRLLALAEAHGDEWNRFEEKCSKTRARAFQEKLESSNQRNGQTKQPQINFCLSQCIE